MCMQYEVVIIHLNYYGGIVSLIKIIQGPSSRMWSKAWFLLCRKCYFPWYLAENPIELFKFPYELKAQDQPNVSVRQITVFTTKIAFYKAIILHLHCPACTAYSEQ